jgi:lipoate-protein ligase A
VTDVILWCDGSHGPLENMRRDAALLERFERSAPGASPVLRLFAFDPHGITLGHSQDPQRDLDLDRCRADGVPWAVRPTGGRAIFHAEEWTYSFAGRCDDPRWGGTLRQAYDAVASLVARSLLRLGVPVEVAGTRLERREAGSTGVGAACFASTGHHEIVLAGRKLVGSAQRRLATGFLQQGSLLIGSGHLRLADYLPIPSESRSRVREELARRSVAAGPWLGTAPLERWADALAGEWGPGLRLLSGEEGLEALTLPKAGSYTEPNLGSNPAPHGRILS